MHLRLKWNIGFFYLGLMMLSTVQNDHIEAAHTQRKRVVESIYTKQTYWGFALFGIERISGNNQWTTPLYSFTMLLLLLFFLPVFVQSALFSVALSFEWTHTALLLCKMGLVAFVSCGSNQPNKYIVLLVVDLRPS